MSFNVIHYVTERGDNMWKIARKHATTVAAIAPLNPQIADVNNIRPGELIHVPVGTIEPDPEPPPARDILVPPAGKVLLGVSMPQDALASWQQIVGRPPTIAHHYAKGSDFAKRLASVPDECIPLINLKPLGAMGRNAYIDILDGAAGAVLDAVAAEIVAYGRPMFLAPMHEPENDGNADTDADYADAFRYVVERIRAAGADPVVVWNMMGWTGYLDRYDALYPGDDVVDWIAWDPYAMNRPQDSWRDFVNWGSTPGIYEWAEPKGKPLMLAEWGIASQRHPDTTGPLLSPDGARMLLDEVPAVRALVYWSEDGQKTSNSFRIDHFPAAWRTFADLDMFQG